MAQTARTHIFIVKGFKIIDDLSKYLRMRNILKNILCSSCIMDNNLSLEHFMRFFTFK